MQEPTVPGGPSGFQHPPMSGGSGVQPPMMGQSGMPPPIGNATGMYPPMMDQAGIQQSYMPPAALSMQSTTPVLLRPAGPVTSQRSRVVRVLFPIMVLLLSFGGVLGMQMAGQHALDLGYPKPSVTIEGISPNNAHKGDTVNFGASGQGRNVSYHWDFGDNNSADGSHVNHSYNSSGSYMVTVIVTDAIGQTSSRTQSITILPALPTASFTASISFGFSVYFDGSASSADPSQTIANYQWDFGDGATDDTQSSFDSHVYNGSGPYTVTLTVTDSSGQKSQPYQQQVTPQQ